jgi:hypothetical protein
MLIWHYFCLIKNVNAISLARETQSIKERMKLAVMKNLRQFLITSAMVILASVSAFAAQEPQDEQKKPKPKENPPVVVVGQDKNDRNKPKDQDKPRGGEDKKKPKDDF